MLQRLMARARRVLKALKAAKKDFLLRLGNSMPAKRLVAFGCAAFYALASFAESKGAGGFQKAIGEVESYQTPVGNLMKAIAAVIALVGAFNIYFKMRASVNGYVLNASLARG